MNLPLLEVCDLAKNKLQTLGLTVKGLHYYTPAQAQRKRRGIYISIDATTRDSGFFGHTFDIARRRAPVKLLYAALGPKLEKLFPGYEVLLDTYVHLEESGHPPQSKPTAENCKDVFDFSKIYEVSYVPLSSLLTSGEVEKCSTFHTYCRKYGLPDVMTQGPHYTSPDSASVEALEAICAVTKVESVLEIGGGVGICGKAAQRLGIRDYTFVDISATACEYLHKHFPKYNVIHQNAFDFQFGWDYDLVLIGIGYQMNPWFLEKRGADLARSASMVFFQSGIMAFYDLEHDWIHGQKNLAAWPWWKPSQTLGAHFTNVVETSFDWQTCALAGHSHKSISLAHESMRRRGFSEIQYQKIEL